MRQKGFAPILIIIILAIVGIVGFLIWQRSPSGQQGQGWGQRPDGSQSGFGDFKGGTPPKPPSGKVTLYKGFWMPASFFYDHKGQSMSDAKDLVAAGANIASIAPTIRINPKGEVKFDAPYDFMEQAIAYWAKNYYEKGIRISLAIEVSYQEDLNARPNKAPEAVPSEVASRPGFLNEYNKIVIEVAKLAEKYHVEMFSPMNEPDLKLGGATASSWGQSILPEVKKYYHGKVLWKAAGSGDEQANINFSGYDILGFDPTPGGGDPTTALAQYRIQLRRMIELAKERAQKYKVPEVMITEFGVWGDALKFSEENKMLAHRIVFEEGKGKVSGFIALDPPSDLDRGLLGTSSLEEITKWFKSL